MGGPDSSKSFLVVLGMHRSGTSALAGVLSLLGFQAGKNLLPANEFNERGYFEDSRLVQQHDALLKSLGRMWYDERSFPLDWLNGSDGFAAEKALIAKLQGEFDLERPCVLKDPRVCRILPLWRAVFSKLGIVPRYVISVRHPWEVAESLRRRDGLAERRASLLYAAHLLEAERETRGQSRTVIQYTSLLENWRAVLEKITSDVGVEFPIFDNNLLLKIDAFLSADLKHCSAEIVFRASTEEGANEDVLPIAAQSPVQSEGTDVSARVAVECVHQYVAEEPMRIALGVYRLLTGVLDEQALQALDSLQADLDRHLTVLEPWLSSAAEGDQLKQELLRPGQRLEKAAGTGAKSVLYWRTHGGEYSEAQTVRQPWHFGVGRETLRFVLPQGQGSIGGLRWDITDRPASCEIFEVWIDDAQGDRVWQWQVGLPLFGQPSPDLKIMQTTGRQDRLQVFSVGFDPHSPVNVPPEIITQVKAGWVFGVVLSASLTTKGLPQLIELLVQSRRAEADSLEVAQTCPLAAPPVDNWAIPMPMLAAELEEVVGLVRQTIASRDQTIAQQSIRLEQLKELQAQLNDALIRAEAQLDFLKDVLLDDVQGDRL